jgi:hypothetical protein
VVTRASKRHADDRLAADVRYGDQLAASTGRFGILKP